MRRWLVFVAGTGLCVCAIAQEAEGKAQSAGDPWLLWKWVNFLILAAGLGYLISKSAAAFFRSRSESIEKGIAEASKLKHDAESQAARIEAKLAGIGREIEELRTTARAEFAQEGRRIEQETANMLKRVQEQAEQEINSTAKHARESLKTYAAKLALDLAEKQVVSRMTPNIDHQLVNSFVHDLSARRDEGAPA